MPNKQTKPKAEDVSILAWIFAKGVKSEKGEPLDFHDRLFLLPILADWSQEIAWKKCSQVGGSVIFNFKAFYALIKLGWNLIYTMPSDSDVEEFVKTKTNPLIRENPHLFEGISSDSVYLKQIGKRNLFFKGTISKTAAISTSSDVNVHDEISRSDQQTVKTYESRIKASKYKGKWVFSNPTTDKDELDEKWQQSDQKEWFVTCSNGHEEMLAWPESIDKERKCFQCQQCKVELTREQRRTGRWIDKDGIPWAGKLNPKYSISGWHTSHLVAPWISAEEILKDADGDLEYFHNFILGEPYNPGDLRVTRSTILDNWTPRDLSKGRQWFLGVDVGNLKHYVLGTELGVVKVGKFTKWQELDDMMAHYKPILVIDALPDNTMSRYFVDTYQNAYMWFPQENSTNPQTVIWWGEKEKKNVVYTHRNRSIDQLIDHILQARMLFGLASDGDLREYLSHWLTLRRIKTVNAKGIEQYEWTSTTGQDHYVFATLFFYLAQLSHGAGMVFTDKDYEQPAIIGRDNKVASSFGAMMEESYE